MGRHRCISGFTRPRTVAFTRLVRQELRSPLLSSFSSLCTTACNTRSSDTERADIRLLYLRRRLAHFDKCQKALENIYPADPPHQLLGRRTTPPIVAICEGR